MIPISGRRQRVGDEQVVWQRNIVAPLEDVWRTLTDPDRLEAWIGTWSGDPASRAHRVPHDRRGRRCARRAATRRGL